MIKPTKNRVLIEPLDAITEQEKQTGILFPEHDNVLPQQGKVIAIGSEVCEVEIGDMVVFNRIKADNIKDKMGGLVEKKYLLIPEELIMAKIE